jgi:hypothetical protein
MKIEITKTVNGAGEVTYKAYHLPNNDEFRMIIGSGSTIEFVENQVLEYKNKLTVSVETVKVYEL